MVGQRCNFVQGLKCDDVKAFQKEVAKEAINKQLFRILDDLKLENGNSIDLNNIVELIAEKTGLQEKKVQIAQHIKQLLQSGKYQFDIDVNGNIRANYSELYMIQMQESKEKKEEAQTELQGFIRKAEEYAKQLEQRHIPVTLISLQKQFGENDLKENEGYVNTAVFSVIEGRKQEK